MLHDKASFFIFFGGAVPTLLLVLCNCLSTEREKSRKQKVDLGVQLADSIHRYRVEHDEIH
jgi:hypothetical protein